MQSSGSTSSQPSHDSLCSSDSFLFSDTDHAEEDTDVFLSEGDSREGQSSRAFYSPDRAGTASPSSQWACDGFGDQERSRIKPSQMERCPSTSSYSALVSSSSGGKMEKEQDRGRAGQTEGDLLFAQKCAELQGFVRPLLELLNGLKMGRFDRGLSSFQQSVAMDRIQRIVGVLQKPTIGGKYLHTLLKVEMMLKLWFPQISPCPPSTTDSSAPPRSTPPHKHKDQLHIPVKKRRLSWSDTDSQTLPPLHRKRFSQGGREEGQAGPDEGGAPTQPAVPGAPARERGPTGLGKGVEEREDDMAEEREGETSGYKVIRWSEPSTTWVHVAPILSPTKSCSSHGGRDDKKGNFAVLAAPSPSASGSPATQDSSISSTTPFSDPHCLPPPQCQPVACQSQPVATETEDCEGGASETCQGRSHSLPPLLKPLNAAERGRVHSPTQT
ncbi:circadian-associated transcriptional repressor-like [Megalops cyprinoides]|uniref:circadian-associated transcriptional repressor-like n=1 Tax=Megalops cyprinoides TaxID=118141 RepID=UPI001863E062|nr:circadian-associated transcriptional repressor-like [Megalops cyprinoides]